ncbi:MULTISPECIES: protein-L-isoaspartate O-methyltransferase [unclassified Beijerinckia]|uniref:protein-L-isoaspartate O-methyltransferase family protein n=1 Tax=unclassified Beijerinckia TaxID=2638183 RepID=UPI000897E8CC|nr:MULTISPECIES: protein-L-isoaspartate O-methyltransferase [unclassified Beijerinckia]MDH7795260.1 protein-L-isoaspartate(D-aspartate) O-methyltransferase [Beijerinckia sp. GAS462]SEB94162.1 protein-L-isoaspartate(D-aspartate) O-methyltransferase [Beijerinckia sp. 28-YEA-48]
MQDPQAVPTIEALRQTMVDCQLRTFDITNREVLAAALEVPREVFVPGVAAAVVYSDRMLDIPGGQGRAMPAPMIVARLLQAADLKPQDKVLVVSSGTGYTAALVSRLAGTVVALDSEAALTAAATANFARIGAGNVQAVTGALADGVAAQAPYDVIIVDGALEAEPEALFGQLGEGGRLYAVVLPEGAAGWRGKATVFEKNSGRIGSRTLFDAAAKPLDAFRRKAVFSF